MAEPFLGEIKIISWNYAPKGWAFCNGQQLPINQNQALFSILGTTYGGNGQTTFGLPDFRGKTAVHWGQGQTAIALGQTGGEAAHTVSIAEMPTHIHQAQGDSAVATVGTAGGNVWAQQAANPFSSNTPNCAMSPSSIGNVGGSQPHNNIQPYLVLNFIIALIGIFPSRN